jgi:hypothetical protein
MDFWNSRTVGDDPFAPPPIVPPVPSQVPRPPPAPPQPIPDRLTKKARQRKGEYMKKLEEDNQELKQSILQYEQKIAAMEAQNEVLKQQMQFFQGYLPPDGAAPPK